MTTERHLTRQAAMLDPLLSVRKGMIALLLAHLWTTTLLGVDYWQPIADPNLRAVVATENRIVAVGDPGYVVTSTNGVDWQQCTAPTAGILTSIAYGNGKYLAVGGKGDAIHSDDGVNWHRTHLGETNLLASVQFLGGQFVVSASEVVPSTGFGLSYHHNLLLSTNLSDWRKIRIHEVSTPIYFFTGIEVDGQYLFGGNNASFNTLTTDFETWRRISAPQGFPWIIKKFLHTPLGTSAFGYWPDTFNDRRASNQWYASREIAFTTNINTWSAWQQINVAERLNMTGATYGHGRIVAVGAGGTKRSSPGVISWDSGSIGVSTNGVHWTFSHLPSGQDLYDICFFQDHFIAVGHRGLILSSADGTEWTEVQPMRPLLPTSFVDVAFADGLFVAVGHAGIITSPNGAWWDVRATNLSSSLWSAAKGTNGWVTVGNQGLVLHSEDGTAWEPQAFPGTNDLGGVAYGPNGFVAVSGTTNGSTIFHSADGHIWTAQPSPAINLFKITYGGGYYVAVGSNNLVESSDGVSWTTRTLTNSIHMTRIIYADGVYFAGSEGQILYSSDRTNWIAAYLKERGGLTSHALAYGPAGYVAGGRWVWFQSQNGSSWQTTYPINSQGSIWHTGAAYGLGTYVMVGTESFFSRNLLPRTRITSTEDPTSLRVNISTDPGLPFVVQSTESLDVPQWQDVPGISGTNVFESFEISTPENRQRFFRAVPRP